MILLKGKVLSCDISAQNPSVALILLRKAIVFSGLLLAGSTGFCEQRWRVDFEQADVEVPMKCSINKVQKKTKQGPALMEGLRAFVVKTRTDGYRKSCRKEF